MKYCLVIIATNIDIWIQYSVYIIVKCVTELLRARRFNSKRDPIQLNSQLWFICNTSTFWFVRRLQILDLRDQRWIWENYLRRREKTSILFICSSSFNSTHVLIRIELNWSFILIESSRSEATVGDKISCILSISSIGFTPCKSRNLKFSDSQKRANGHLPRAQHGKVNNL